MILHLALAGDDALGDKQFDKLTLEELDSIGLDFKTDSYHSFAAAI